MSELTTTSCEGYLYMRNTLTGPPMVRKYCVLIGTLLTAYNSTEEAELMILPQADLDVVAVEEWDGRGASHTYLNAFKIVTGRSKTWYCYADTPTEKEKWLRSIEMLVLVLGPSKLTVSVQPQEPATGATVTSPSVSGKDVAPAASKDASAVCPVTGLPATVRCRSCGQKFNDKYASQEIPLLHSGYCVPMRVCDDCLNTQRFINYIRAMLGRFQAGTCLYPEALNPDCSIELHQASQMSGGGAAAIALDMYKRGDISMDELKQLLMADLRYQDEAAKERGVALDLEILALHKEFRSPGFGVAEAVVLLHKYVTKDVSLFKPIVEQLLQLSFTRIDDIEFYWPQIIHAYLRIPIFFDLKKLFWLEDLIVSTCIRSIHLALQLVWQLQGALEDSLRETSIKENVAKFPRIIRLMLLVEQSIMGDAWSYKLSGRGDRKSRIGPPAGTDEQAHVIEQLLIDLSHFKKNRPKTPLPAPGSSQDASELHSRYNDEEVLFSELSRFQQHLLTPKGISCQEWSFIKDANGDFRPRNLSEKDKRVLSQYFQAERNFVKDLTDIAERLRFVQPVSARKQHLPEEVQNLKLPDMAYIPLCKASDAFARVVRVPEKEGTVFSTRARAPTMIIFEVIKGEGQDFGTLDQSPNGSPRRSSTRVVSIVNEAAKKLESNEEDDVGALIQQNSPNGLSTLLQSGDDSGRIFSFLKTVSGEGDVAGAKQQGDNITDTNSVASLEDTLDDLSQVPGKFKPPSSTASTSSGTTSEARSDLDFSVSFPGVEAKLSEEEKAMHDKDLEAAFGESWDHKRARIKQNSPLGHLPGWDIVSMIAKSNDDLRQEVFLLQLVQKFYDIFQAANVPLWLHCYRIIATGSTAGLVETLTNSVSLDALKKRDGYVNLRTHFERSYGPPDSPRFLECQRNFINSLAGYSLLTFFLQVKDRHNGNIMLDNAGHVIHIDFGFILGIAPGGSWSIETAPFKLTAEMVELMGGVDSDKFNEYVTMCTRGFLALQKHADEIVTLVDIMAHQSPFPCFAGKDVQYILTKLRGRFKTYMNKKETVAHVLSLIKKSNNNYYTRQYDNFQKYSNGIMP